MKMALIAAVVLTAITAIPANAAFVPCNTLGPSACVKCAIGRGYTPAQYKPYCGISEPVKAKKVKKKVK